MRCGAVVYVNLVGCMCLFPFLFFLFFFSFFRDEAPSTLRWNSGQGCFVVAYVSIRFRPTSREARALAQVDLVGLPPKQSKNRTLHSPLGNSGPLWPVWSKLDLHKGVAFLFLFLRKRKKEEKREGKGDRKDRVSIFLATGQRIQLEEIFTLILGYYLLHIPAETHQIIFPVRVTSPSPCSEESLFLHCRTAVKVDRLWRAILFRI